MERLSSVEGDSVWQEAYQGDNYRHNIEVNRVGDEYEMNAAYQMMWSQVKSQLDLLSTVDYPLNVFDFGAGDGRVAEAMLNYTDQSLTVWGFELSDELLLKGWEREQQERLHRATPNRYEPVKMDIRHLGLRPHSGDLAVSVFVLHHLRRNELTPTLSQMAASLKQDAELIVTVNTVDEETSEEPTALEIMNHRVGKTDEVLATVNNNLYTADRYRRAAEDAGFTVLELINAPYPNTIARPKDEELRNKGMLVYETMLVLRVNHQLDR